MTQYSYEQYAFRKAIRESSLTPPQRWIAAVLCDHADNQTGQCWPSQGTLVRETGHGLATIKRALKELIACGAVELLTSGKGGNSSKSNLYRLHPDFNSSERAIAIAQTELTTNQVTNHQYYDSSIAQTEPLKSGGTQDRSLAPGPSSGAAGSNPVSDGIHCSVDGCKHVFPAGLDVQSEAFRVAFMGHFKADHNPKAHSEPLPPGTQRRPRAYANDAKWTCEQCGMPYQHLGMAKDKICNRCRRQIEG